MQLVFWTTICLTVMCWIWQLKHHDYYNWLTYIILGIYLPLALYMCGWSTLIYKQISDEFYLIFIYFNFTLAVVFLIENLDSRTARGFDSSPFLIVLKERLVPIEAINLLVAIALLAENYITTGSVVPALVGLQDHTSHASGLVYITNSQYFILAADLFFYIATRKKRYLLYIVILIMLPMVTRASRMSSMMEIVSIISLYLYLRRYYVSQNKPHSPRSLKQIIAALTGCIILIFVINAMVNLGASRMNHYGTYDYLYSTNIGYTGPKIFGEAGAWYYGYFPLSFNNLNINVTFNVCGMSYIGLSSFKAFYYGILHFASFGVPTDIANTAKIVISPNCTVVTGFWDFWYDYGPLCFIPMVVSGVIYLALKRRLCRANKNPMNVALYFYWVPLWAFMSFNDTAYFDCVFNNMIITYAVIWYYFGTSFYMKKQAFNRRSTAGCTQIQDSRPSAQLDYHSVYLVHFESRMMPYSPSANQGGCQ